MGQCTRVTWGMQAALLLLSSHNKPYSMGQKKKKKANPSDPNSSKNTPCLNTARKCFWCIPSCRVGLELGGSEGMGWDGMDEVRDCVSSKAIPLHPHPAMGHTLDFLAQRHGENDWR